MVENQLGQMAYLPKLLGLVYQVYQVYLLGACLWMIQATQVVLLGRWFTIGMAQERKAERKRLQQRAEVRFWFWVASAFGGLQLMQVVFSYF